MRILTLVGGLLLATVSPSLWAQELPGTTTPRKDRPLHVEQTREHRLASDWGLRTEEWERYHEIMKGPLGIYSPNLDPLTALGIEARSDAERRRYAELQVQAEARRVEKLLTYQRAYDEAWLRLQPGVPRVKLPDAVTGPAQSAPSAIVMGGSGRTAVFVRDNCTPCDRLVQKPQTSGAGFDLYMIGSRSDDGHIRAWAQRVGVDAAKVRNRTITLNHDAGRWMALGLSGELPAAVQQVNGTWQRLP
ncbi:TIGR03759 family integrating conjugative element protein [Pseudomonas aeruginosa]|uniref:TIGR03759 family integrating conjugative element protein n=1 Tax=Pseudomonas aeruginosa TaxID=287 RepID=UPI000BB82EF0|nr:TIGR03759 family integrating conjugative element protein [Pseudomonas aeruginosa]ELC7284817.1 TIGR03759 family integrating conjugative element protein [Pseudomonas aeruginosa]ELM3823581.1 TIGR03759 family integrating conjugative element protein [Pseudomonas aeruginosa]ELN9534155.1 TIGR03759 family integrating conjugative element protein [Pseudomonas aeruginosa]MBH8744019.1 TIGR03759 family integrating conjugative element protein [Pseudomonas aeruginosa]MBX6107963.1 TIGR03759 family integrat